MTAIELLRKCQGDMSQGEFGDKLGVSQAQVSMIYAGKRRPGAELMKRLGQAFPEVRTEVTTILFAPEYHDSEERVTDVNLDCANENAA